MRKLLAVALFCAMIPAAYADDNSSSSNSNDTNATNSAAPKDKGIARDNRNDDDANRQIGQMCTQSVNGQTVCEKDAGN